MEIRHRAFANPHQSSPLPDLLKTVLSIGIQWFQLVNCSNHELTNSCVCNYLIW